MGEVVTEAFNLCNEQAVTIIFVTCRGSYLSIIFHFHTCDLIGFMVQLLSAVNCWLKCMLLDPYNQTDHPECKSRPDSGLSAITELDPGYITGKLYASLNSPWY